MFQPDPQLSTMQSYYFKNTIFSSTATNKKVNANSEHGNTNRRPGPVNTNRGTRLVYASPGSVLTRAGK